MITTEICFHRRFSLFSKDVLCNQKTSLLSNRMAEGGSCILPNKGGTIRNIKYRISS